MLDGLKAHTTQKPKSLLHRIISSTTNPGDVVLDPFCGTGTTAAVSKRLGRDFITIDRVEAYVGVAEKRLANTSPALVQEEGVFVDAPKPRVPFVSLVEAGRLPVGTTLRLKGTQIEGKVHADGTVTAGGHKGSIHKVAALCLGVPTCNGWVVWRYADPVTGEDLLIDALRAVPLQA
jgi:modification methylase